MFMRHRGHTLWAGVIIGLIALAVVIGCVVLYRIQARETRQHFDDMLQQRADDVTSVVLDDNGGVDTSAFQYAGDLNSLGMDAYLFYPDGSPLFVPEKRRVDGLPAIVPLKSAQAGDQDVRTISLGGARTRVLTYPVTNDGGEASQIAIIVQIGRSEAPLAAALRRLAALIAGIGAALVLGVVIGGMLLLRQLSIPVRRSLAQQQAFVANAAHELRTPLSVIQATAELALMRPRSAEEYTTSLERIGRTVTQTSTMVDDLLTLAQIDAAREPPQFAPTDLGVVTATVVAEATARYPDNPITVAAQGETIVAGDATLLQRLLTNLVDNACRYNPEGTPVQLTLTARRKWVVLRVIDEGQGIVPDEVPRLFERFFRGKTGRQSGQHGAGIGLSLVRQIVAIHRGTIGITSRVGVGTTVTVVLPRLTSAAPEITAPAESHVALRRQATVPHTMNDPTPLA